MNRERAPENASTIPRRSALVFGGLLLILFIAGSAADYSLANALFTPENALGTVLAAYGEAPALLALVAAGTLAVTARPPVHLVLRWLLIIGGAGLIIVGTLALIIRPEEYWALPTIVRTLIALALSAAAIWATARVSAGATWQAMCALAAALFAVVAVEMVLVQGVKILWERPRMRMLAETGAEFSPWWSPGYEDRDALAAQGAEASEFKSFPSGHSANAATLMMLTGFALVRQDVRRHTARLFWVGAAWALLVALSRLTVGAHFLTDTAAGLAVTFVVVIIISALAVKVLDARLLDRLPRGGPRPAPAPRHGRATH